ncbi:MAG: hypothetical protein V3W14_02320 [Candidatus Neomarinimicrobiota bacterium]
MANHLKIVLCLLTALPLWSQEEEQAAVGYLRIFTDTDLVQIYIDGEVIGYSPILEKLTLIPGWHNVSFFPSDFKWTHWTHRQRRTIMNVIQSGTYNVVIKPGETTELHMEWHDIELKLAQYESSRWIGGVVGLSMVAVMLLLIESAI